MLEDAHGKPLVINGLWGIAFGNGGMSGKPDELFFTSGRTSGAASPSSACTACSARSRPPEGRLSPGADERRVTQIG